MAEWNIPTGDDVAKLVQDGSIQQLINVQRGILLSSGNKDAILAFGDVTVTDLFYRKEVAAAETVEDVNGLFAEWWHSQWDAGTGDTDSEKRKSLLRRWFGVVLDDERVHGVKLPLFSTSESPTGELTDDSAGLTCEPSTEETAGQDDFAKLAQFWCVETSMEKNEDGTHEIYAVQYIDDDNTVRSGEHLCEVAQKNTYLRQWLESGYKIVKQRCHKAVGYAQWRDGTDRQGNTYPYMMHPKYYAGEDADGTITCGTGLAPVNYASHTNGVAKWRKRGTQYSGASCSTSKWMELMINLKYAKKGNSGTIEGCTSYNYQYTAVLGETGVERILLTTAQAANLLVGSNVILGDMGTGTSKDRGTASMYSICKNKRISAIETVTVDDTEYAAVYIDNDGTTFDTETGVTYISTMPYWSGWNDTVQGNDGSRYSPTSGKEPGLIQKCEFQIGAYIINSDELFQWGTNSDGDYTLDIYTCHDHSKVASSITSDYEKVEDATLIFPAGTKSQWMFIQDTAILSDASVLWPAAVGDSAGSGTGCKAALSVSPASSGVRASWRVATLNNGGIGGLSALSAGSGPSHAHWYGALGADGLAG